MYTHVKICGTSPTSKNITKMQREDENMYVNPIELAVRDDRGGAQSSVRNQSDPYQSPKSDVSSERQRGRYNLFMKVVATISVVLLVVTLAIMIGFHITQQREWKKGSESQAQQYSEIAGKFENLENKTKDRAREAKLNLQQLASFFSNKMARDVAVFQKISQAHNVEAKERFKNISEDLETLVEKLTVRYLREAMQTYLSCRGVDLELAKSRNVTGGVFNMAITGVGTREVYCNTEIDGGGWIVMQRRMDGSVDFYRTWNEYVAGFGQASGEYWLGLEALYQLTKNGNVELRIDMITHNGTFYYAKYSNFQIGPSSDNYRLRVSGYSGNVTDSLAYHNNYPFTTNDNDNDRASNGNCAAYFSGAWWFDNCHRSHLNGNYKTQDRSYGVIWYHSPTYIHLKFAEMKIRQKN